MQGTGIPPACDVARQAVPGCAQLPMPVSAAGSKAKEAKEAEPAAAAAAAASDAATRQAISTTFFTKRVADPNLVPLLLAKGVQFGAVRVRPGLQPAAEVAGMSWSSRLCMNALSRTACQGRANRRNVGPPWSARLLLVPLSHLSYRMLHQDQLPQLLECWPDLAAVQLRSNWQLQALL